MIDYIPLTATAGKRTTTAELRALADFPADAKWPAYLSDEWLALLETIAFARPLQCDDDPTFTDGAGI